MNRIARLNQDDAHSCWRVQKALDEQGIEYEVVKGPLRPGKRSDLEQLSGQRKYPTIEFEDGRVYHLNFTASDGRGGQCTGTTGLCVPHDQRPGHVCIDQGPLYSSTGPCS